MANNISLLGGEFDYVQDTAPSGTKGQTWLDTSANPPVAYVYADLGNGGDWHRTNALDAINTNLDDKVSNAGASISEIEQGSGTWPGRTFVDFVERFRAKGYSITTNQVREANEALMLGFTESTTGMGTDNINSNNEGDEVGIKINPNTDLDGVRVKLSGDTGDDRSEICDFRIRDSNLNELAIASATESVGKEIQIEGVDLQAGTDYYVTKEKQGGGNYHDAGYLSSPLFPYSCNGLDVISGLHGTADDNNRWAFSDIWALEKVESGDAQVEFDSALLRNDWVSATVKPVLDGETATVDVEEYDGSSWNVIHSDVNGYITLSANADNPIRFNASLSRSDSTNEPRIEYIEQRWIR